VRRGEYQDPEVFQVVQPAVCLDLLSWRYERSYRRVHGYRPCTAYSSEYKDNPVEMARRAEEAEFDTMLTGDHVGLSVRVGDVGRNFSSHDLMSNRHARLSPDVRNPVQLQPLWLDLPLDEPSRTTSPVIELLASEVRNRAMGTRSSGLDSAWSGTREAMLSVTALGMAS